MIRSNALALNDDYTIERSTTAIEPQPRRILLIEDNKSDVFLIKRMLRDIASDESLEFIDVPRMVDALELMDVTLFDLIILDLSLLDVDGTASVAAIHSQAPNVPIIVHTGAACPKLREEAIMCGAKHYLVKGRESPFAFKFMIQQTLSYAEF